MARYRDSMGHVRVPSHDGQLPIIYRYKSDLEGRGDTYVRTVKAPSQIIFEV